MLEALHILPFAHLTSLVTRTQIFIKQTEKENTSLVEQGHEFPSWTFLSSLHGHFFA